jgi:hypothetical protein
MPRAKSLALIGLAAVKLLARLAARRAVEAELRAKGLKPRYIRGPEIAEQAKV